jgi:hypothetical protein
MDDILRIAIPAAAAILTSLVRRVVPLLPKPLVPILATVFGALGAALSGQADTATTATLSGLAAIGVREIVDQTSKAAKR